MNVQNRKVLDSDTTAVRITFFRTAHNLTISVYERPVLYLDETWINQNHSQKYTRQNINEEAWQSLQERGAVFVCATYDQQKQASFQAETGSTNARLQ